MGDAADDILNGMVCQHCGEWMDDILAGVDAPGYPRSCVRCRHQDAAFKPQPAPAKVSCEVCGKRVKAAGLHDHKRAVHVNAGEAGDSGETNKGDKT